MSAVVRTYPPKGCESCQALFTPTGPRSRLCEACRGVTHSGNGHAPKAAEPDTAPDALEVIDAFALDFNVGNAVRFLLEKNDGDEMANLLAARTYVERAIARLEREAA
jgi:hypothetical protein